MELELGLKITKTRDDSTSVSEYRLAKDRTGPVFQSRETNTMFILIANLKGYKRNNIYIKISEDGSKITISGEKPIQDMLMVGWVMFKKDVEITSFSKVFQIPDGVILDRIKAKYDEEECMLSIVMPKSVKGICGARIEEVKEEESGRERSELERSEDDHILNSFGETSGKGSEESEVEEMKAGGSVVEREEESSENMLDDANVDRIKETIKAETEESNLGIKNGGGTSVREKVGKVEHEAMETSDLECGEGFVEKNEGVVSDKMLNEGMSEEKIRKEIEVGNGASVREKGGKEAYEAMKTSEIEQKVSAGIPQNIGDKSHDREFEVQEMEEYGTYRSNEEEKEKMVSHKMLDGAKGNMIAAMIDKEMEESKLGTEGGYAGSVRENDRKAGCEAIELEKNVEAQQMQEVDNAVENVDRQEAGKMLAKANGSKQKELEQPKSEIEDMHKRSVEEVVSMERFEETKTSELNKDVADHSPGNIGGMNQEKESEVCGIQQMKRTEGVEGNMDGRESEGKPTEADNAFQENIFGKTIQKDIEKPNEIDERDEESQREKAGKEGFEAIITLREEFPKQLPKAPEKVGKEKNVSKIKESKKVTEAVVERKGKEIECSEEKGESEEPKGLHAEARTLIEKDITEETRHEEIEKPKSGIKGSDQQGEFEVLDSIITEELPKQVGEKLPDGSKGFNDEKIEEPNEVIREAMAVAESLMQMVEGETSKKAAEKANRAISKSTDASPKEDEESDIEKKAKEGSYAPDIIPKKVGEAIAIVENDKTEYGTVKLKGEGSIRMNLEANKDFEEDITRDRTEKEIGEPRLKPRDQLGVQENVEDGGGVDGSKILEIPEVRKTEDVREKGAKTEQSVKKVTTEKYEDFGKDITRKTIQKEIKDPKIRKKERDQCLQEKTGEGKTDEASTAAQEEFPMKIADSPTDKKERLKDTKIEEVLVKQKSEEKVGKTEDIKDDAETEQKVKEERYEKIQVEKNGGKMKDITRETTWKETNEPEIQTKEKDQQCSQEEMNKRRPEVSNAVQEEKLKETMPEKAKEVQEELVKQQIEEQMEETEGAQNKGAEIEQFVKKEKGEKYERIQVEERGGLRKDITRETTQKETEEPKNQNEEKDQQCLQDAMSEGRFEASTTERDGPKDEKTEETGKVKEEVVKRKTKEREFVESTTRERIQETDGERITKTLHEVPKEEHPKALDIGANERELQPHAEVVRMGSKEIEQVSAKKQKTEQLSPTIHSKDTLESRKESVDQDIVKSKKTKEAVKGEQCTYNTESTKGVAAIEDQVAKPRFPSTQKYEVEKGKLQEGCIERYEPSPESQKEYLTKDFQDSIEMKDQESQDMEVLRPEVPVEELLKKREQDTKKDELQKGQEVEETMQEETEQPENRIDDRDQQYVQGDVGKEEYASNATLEREKYMTQNVNDEKLKIKEEIKKTDSERTQEKEDQRKSKAVEKEEAEPLEAISSLPCLTGIGVKKGKPEPHHKGAKPSEGEENRKSENVVEESPNKNTDTEFQKSIEQVAPIENEFQAHILENQGLGEKQEVYGQEAAPDECDYKERKKDKMPEMEEMAPEVEQTNRFKQDAERMQEDETTIVTTPKKGMEKLDREEMSPIPPTEIQRKEPCELSWSSMATHRYNQLEEKDKSEASDEEVGNQESKKDERERQGKQEVVGEKARKLKEEEECEVIIVEKEEEEESGGNKGKTKRTKKLFVPLVVAGSTLLISLVFIHVHRNRARKRSN